MIRILRATSLNIVQVNKLTWLQKKLCKLFSIQPMTYYHIQADLVLASPHYRVNDVIALFLWGRQEESFIVTKVEDNFITIKNFKPIEYILNLSQFEDVDTVLQYQAYSERAKS